MNCLVFRLWWKVGVDGGRDTFIGDSASASFAAPNSSEAPTTHIFCHESKTLLAKMI
jgi:hypothetical protein